MENQSDDFITILRVLTRRLSEKEDLIQSLQHEISDLLASHRSLRRTNDDYREKYLTAHRELVKARSEENPLVTAKAEDYMVRAGQYIRNEKINMIKNVRDATQWDLKTSKDFVEAWLVQNPEPPTPQRAVGSQRSPLATGGDAGRRAV